MYSMWVYKHIIECNHGSREYALKLCKLIQLKFYNLLVLDLN